jgi:hypothetical protein
MLGLEYSKQSKKNTIIYLELTGQIPLPKFAEKMWNSYNMAPI